MKHNKHQSEIMKEQAVCLGYHMQTTQKQHVCTAAPRKQDPYLALIASDISYEYQSFPRIALNCRKQQRRGDFCPMHLFGPVRVSNCNFIDIDALPGLQLVETYPTHSLFAYYHYFFCVGPDGSRSLQREKVALLAFPGTHNLKGVIADSKLNFVEQIIFSNQQGGVILPASSEPALTAKKFVVSDKLRQMMCLQPPSRQEGEESVQKECPTSAINNGISVLWRYRVHKGFLSELGKAMAMFPVHRVVLMLRRGVCSNRACFSDDDETQHTATEVLLSPRGHSQSTAIAAGTCKNQAEKQCDVGYTDFDRIIVTGHSLGGAVACLYTLSCLHHDPEMKDKISCVTFGAPLVGDVNMARCIQMSGWTDLFQHFVYRSDVVPRLLANRLRFQDILATVGSDLWKGLWRQQKATKDDSVRKEKDATVRKTQNMMQDVNVFACAGWYHFLSPHDDVAYFSTAVSQEAFEYLKNIRNSRGKNVGDHTVRAYNEGMSHYTMQMMAMNA